MMFFHHIELQKSVKLKSKDMENLIDKYAGGGGILFYKQVMNLKIFCGGMRA